MYTYIHRNAHSFQTEKEEASVQVLEKSEDVIVISQDGEQEGTVF